MCHSTTILSYNPLPISLSPFTKVILMTSPLPHTGLSLIYHALFFPAT
ncbi:hypothetical protein PEC331060_00580 [Pectobacterium carotovorum subsp. carotovorum]|nr:hypothetical protein PEC331060_00580 [Pectobacterium carotovorum subsp. carotovorum]